MLLFLVFLVIVLLITNIWVGSRYLDYRSKLKQRGFVKNWPIPLVLLDQLHPSFVTNDLGPTLLSQVKFVGKGNLNVLGGTSDSEAWILAVLSKTSRNIFEFGTCTGKTTYLLAANSPEDAKITTLTLRPDQLNSYEKKGTDGKDAIHDALQESVFTKFLYSNTPEEKKIRQLFGDSKHFDETPYEKLMDLIFIDGSHAYSYVMSDTEKALKMIAPGGIILWHDYRGPRQTQDVFKALNQLSKKMKLFHIKETSLVAFKAAQ